MPKKTLTDTNLTIVLKALADYARGVIGGDALATTIENAVMFEGVDEVNETAPAPKATRGKAKAAAPVEEDDEDDEDEEEDDEEAALRKELGALTLKALRKRAIDAGFDKGEVMESDTESLIESLVDDALSEDDDADEDEAEEEDEDDDDETPSRESLLALSLAALKRLAKEEYSIAAGDLKGLDKDGIADLILGDADDDDEDDEEDEEAEGYTEDDLAEMSLAELKEIAEAWEITVKPGSKSPTYIKAILAAQEEDEDED